MATHKPFNFLASEPWYCPKAKDWSDNECKMSSFRHATTFFLRRFDYWSILGVNSHELHKTKQRKTNILAITPQSAILGILLLWNFVWSSGLTIWISLTHTNEYQREIFPSNKSQDMVAFGFCEMSAFVKNWNKSHDLKMFIGLSTISMQRSLGRQCLQHV